MSVESREFTARPVGLCGAQPTAFQALQYKWVPAEGENGTEMEEKICGA